MNYLQQSRLNFGFNMGFVIFLILSTIYLPKAHSTELRFVDKTIEAGLSYPLIMTWGLSWGDFNDDNLLDVYIKNHIGTQSVYQNLGNGTFKDVTIQYGCGSFRTTQADP